jgi:hypothetical protein
MLKANAALLVFCLLFNVEYTATESNTTVIEIPSIQSRVSSSGTSKQIRYFYTKTPNLISFNIASASSSFITVPGLSLSVNHDQPMLYRIEFQGGCQGQAEAYNFVHLLIDGRVLIENELLPNNDRRQAVAPHLGVSIDQVDQRSGGLSYAANVGFVSSCPRFRTVVLPSGTHSIEVGVRISGSSMALYGSQLDVELSSYDPATDVGLSYPIIR